MDHGRTEGAGRCLAQRFKAIFCPQCGLELCIRTGNMQAKNYISEEIFASGDAECILSPPFPDEDADYLAAMSTLHQNSVKSFKTWSESSDTSGASEDEASCETD